METNLFVTFSVKICLPVLLESDDALLHLAESFPVMPASNYFLQHRNLLRQCSVALLFHVDILGILQNTEVQIKINIGGKYPKLEISVAQSVVAGSS